MRIRQKRDVYFHLRQGKRQTWVNNSLPDQSKTRISKYPIEKKKSHRSFFFFLTHIPSRVFRSYIIGEKTNKQRTNPWYADQIEHKNRNITKTTATEQMAPNPHDKLGPT